MNSSVSARFRLTPAPDRRVLTLYAYAASLVLACAIVAALAIREEQPRGEAWVAMALLALVAWLAERQSVQITAHVQSSVTVLPILFAAVVFGPLVAMGVGAASLLVDLRSPYIRWVIWTATRSLAAGLAGLAAALTLAEQSTFARLVIAVAVAAAVEAVADIVLNSVTLTIRQTGSFGTTARTLGQLLFGALPLYVPVIAVLAYAYLELSAWTVLLFFVPALAAQRLWVLYQEQRRLALDLASANTRLESANLSFATALVATLDARDRYTAGHSAAVAIYSRDIARRLGLSEDEQRLAHLAGLVHDIGKIGLPPWLVEKTGALTLQERRQMESHSPIGERILENVDDYAEVARIVRHHHERVDGQGYPDGLVKDEIPLISRIIAVADAYNAMTSDRPYREAMPSQVARLRLAQAVETQFDTSVVAAFEAILATAGQDYRTATGAEFTLRTQTLSDSSAVAAA